MNLFLICAPRSRSWFLLNSLCRHYKLDNMGEYFARRYFELARDKGVPGFQKYIDACKNYNQTSTGLKIFFQNLISHGYLDTADRQLVITKFLETFPIKSDDKLVVAYRKDSLNQVASFLYARATNKFIYMSKAEFKNHKMILDLKDNQIIKVIDLVLSNNLLLPKVLGVLDNHNLTYDLVEYADAEKYLLENNVRPDSITRDNQLDYSTLIENYIELSDKVNIRCNIIKEKLDWIRLE